LAFRNKSGLAGRNEFRARVWEDRENEGTWEGPTLYQQR
jgi:hypothetical protein